MLKRYKNKILIELRGKGYSPLDFSANEIVEDFVVHEPERPQSTNLASQNTSDEKAARLAAIRAANRAKANQQGVTPQSEKKNATLKLSAFVLSFRKTPLSFGFIENPNDFHLFLHKYTKFAPKFDETQIIGEYVSIDKVIEIFHTWLNDHVNLAIEEDLEPDLWGDAYRLHDILGNEIIETQDTSDFSEHEIHIIEVALEKFIDLVEEEFHPDEMQSQQIRERLDYLAEATKRSNKFDWQGLVISTLIGIMINLTLDTEKGRLLYELFLKALEASKHLLK